MLTIPPALLSWATYQSSLTQGLKAVAGDAQLDILGQTWDPPNIFDQQVLGLHHHSVFHRDISMSAWGEVCWFARTIIPDRTYEMHKVVFDRLKTESLGDLIFNDNRITRASLQHYSIDNQCVEYQWFALFITCQNELLWARRSQFMVDTSPFFLIEILLPPLMRYSL